MGMGKVSANEKVRAVERYIKNEGTLRAIASEYGVHHSCLERWMSLYKTFGPKGLERPQENTKYPAKVKEAAVQSYLDGKTLKRVCEDYHIRSISVLQKWLEKYEEEKTKKV